MKEELIHLAAFAGCAYFIFDELSGKSPSSIFLSGYRLFSSVGCMLMMFDSLPVFASECFIAGALFRATDRFSYVALDRFHRACEAISARRKHDV